MKRHHTYTDSTNQEHNGSDYQDAFDREAEARAEESREDEEEDEAPKNNEQ